MTTSGGSFTRKVLLIEPDGLVRGTVASVCRDMEIARVRQTISVASAEQWIKTGAPQALLISLVEGDAALDFLTRLRAGAFRCDADMPVVAMARVVDAALVARLKELDVRRLLLQPFRVHDVIHTLEQLWPAREALPA
jgi:DNA-binding NarL/FixJ family response regulator